MFEEGTGEGHDEIHEVDYNYYDEYYVPNERETVEQIFYFKTSPFDFWPSICFTQQINFANSKWDTKLDYRDCSDVAYAASWGFPEGHGILREGDQYSLDDAYNRGWDDGYD